MSWKKRALAAALAGLCLLSGCSLSRRQQYYGAIGRGVGGAWAR